MKKVKLFTTIASLCLAVALMAFGVYAATTVNVGVTGNVSLVVDPHVKATVVLTDTKSTNTEEVLAQGATSKLVGNTTGKTLFQSAANAAGTPTVAEQTHAYGALSFKGVDTNGNIEFEYTVTVTNTAADTDKYQYVHVAITKTEITAHDGKTVDANGYSVAISGDLANGGVVSRGTPKSYTVKVTIDADYSVSTALNIGTSIALTMSDSESIS